MEVANFANAGYLSNFFGAESFPEKLAEEESKAGVGCFVRNARLSTGVTCAHVELEYDPIYPSECQEWCAACDACHSVCCAADALAAAAIASACASATAAAASA